VKATDPSKAIAGIEAWYDSAMDRASGWYKRQVRWSLLFMGLALACVTNADTIQVAMHLAVDGELQDSVVALAAAAAVPAAEGVPPETPADTPTVAPPGAATEGPPADQSGAAAEAPAAASPEVEPALEAFSKQLREKIADGNLLAGFGDLPVGWDVCGGTASESTYFDPATCYPRKLESGTAWAYKVLGLLLTALAASLGAPFWFGLLQQLNAARSSGPKPATTTDSAES
jgi:hypothetical protein